MSDRAALLAAVKAFPEEDTPRLVFADWLDENGDERDRDWAALIRWGCAIGNRSSVFHVERNHATAFGWRFPSRVADGVYTLRRGFYEAFTGTAADWLAHADALLTEHPVRRVTLTTVPDVLHSIWDRIAQRGPANYGVRLADKMVEFQAGKGDDLIAIAIRTRWKGIKFELPPAPVPPVSMVESLVDDNVAGFHAYFTQQLNAMVQSLAVPPHMLSPDE